MPGRFLFPVLLGEAFLTSRVEGKQARGKEFGAKALTIVSSSGYPILPSILSGFESCRRVSGPYDDQWAFLLPLAFLISGMGYQ